MRTGQGKDAAHRPRAASLRWPPGFCYPPPVRHEDAAKVVLVRAVEEMLPDRIAPETLLEAHAAAGDPAQERAWVTGRAAYLVDHALGNYRELLIPSEVALPGPWVCIGLAVVVGLASNYLGPTGSIHVVLNPIIVLIVWNLLVYAGLTVGWITRSRDTDEEVRRDSDASLPEPTGAPTAPRIPYRPGILERLLLGRAF